MEKEIVELLKKENLGNLTEEEKHLLNKLFNHVEVEYYNKILFVDCRYFINDRFWVEVYGKEVEGTVDETIYEIDFSENNHFRFYENGEEITFKNIIEKERQLKLIDDLEIELNDLLYSFYNDDKFKIVSHQDYIIQKMPKGYFDEFGELNLKYDVSNWTYEELLDYYINVLEEEIEDIKEKMEVLKDEKNY